MTAETMKLLTVLGWAFLLIGITEDFLTLVLGAIVCFLMVIFSPHQESP